MRRKRNGDVSLMWNILLLLFFFLINTNILILLHRKHMYLVYIFPSDVYHFAIIKTNNYFLRFNWLKSTKNCITYMYSLGCPYYNMICSNNISISRCQYKICMQDEMRNKTILYWVIILNIGTKNILGYKLKYRLLKIFLKVV